MAAAPARRSAISRSATTRGPGERPSRNTCGRSVRAWARRRCLTRPPATLATMSAIIAGVRSGSIDATRATVTPIGSARTGGTADTSSAVGVSGTAVIGRRR